MFAMKEGTVSPILYRLEDDGLAISRWRGTKGQGDFPEVLLCLTAG